jgi:hypothetical protein
MLSLTDLSAITNAQDFTSIAQPLNSAGTQIPIIDSVADNFLINALGFHALPEQSS